MDVKILDQNLHDGGRMFRVGVQLGSSFHEEGVHEAIKDYCARNSMNYKDDEDAKRRIADQLGDAGLNRMVSDFLAVKAAPTVINELNMHVMFNPVAALEDANDVMGPGECKLNIDLVLKPVMHLSDYGPLTVHLPAAKVTDEEVDEYLKSTLEEHATYQDAGDGPLEKGDFAKLDLLTTQDGKKVDNLSGKGFSLQIDEAHVPADMVANVVGMRPGDTKEFDFKFSDDDVDSHHVRATLRGREVRRVPKLDDDYAKSNFGDDVHNVDELRKAAKEQLTEQVAQQIQQQKDSFVDAELAKRLDSKIVNVYYERARDNMLATLNQQLAAQGITLQQFMEQQGLSEQEFNTAMMMQVGQSLHQGFALDALFDHLGEEPTEDEMESALKQMAGPNVDQARKDLDAHHTWFVVRDAAERLHAHNYAVEHTTFVQD